MNKQDLREILIDKLHYAYIEGDANKPFETVLNEELSDLSEFHEEDGIDVLEIAKYLTPYELFDLRDSVIVLSLGNYKDAQIEATHMHDILVNVALDQKEYEKYFVELI